jgi:hypothetical protein
VTGPCRYLDLTFCFFLIRIPLLAKNLATDPSSRIKDRVDLMYSARQISPFLLNLNLNPLYSSLGGSTIRAEPLTKKPIVVDLRLKPL